MEQYISKSALVEEIRRWLGETDKGFPNEHNLGRFDAYERTLSFLDTLEVKKIDLDREIEEYCKSEQFKESLGTVKVTSLLAKHFFELGLKAKDWEKERMEECPFRKVGCTMYEDKILECNGACSWVVDYPKLKELKAQKGK